MQKYMKMCKQPKDILKIMRNKPQQTVYFTWKVLGTFMKSTRKTVHKSGRTKQLIADIEKYRQKVLCSLYIDGIYYGTKYNNNRKIRTNTTLVRDKLTGKFLRQFAHH